MTHSVIAFVDKMDKSSVEAAKRLAEHQGCSVVDFYSEKLEDLLLVAKYRVVRRPTIIILDGQKVIGRLFSVPEWQVISSIIEQR